MRDSAKPRLTEIASYGMDLERVVNVFKKLQVRAKWLRQRLKGAIFIEYLLLVTLVGFGVIVGLAALRSSLTNELLDLANAINAINS